MLLLLLASIISVVTTAASIPAITPCGSKRYCQPCYCFVNIVNIFVSHDTVSFTYFCGDSKNRTAVIRKVIVTQKGHKKNSIPNKIGLITILHRL